MESNGKVVLKAEVLFAGVACPVCGDKKTAGARTCRICYKVLGREITRRVDAVIEAGVAAKNGHLASHASERSVAREVVWGPVLAQVRIGKDASFRRPGNGGIEPYWECRKDVRGGYVSLFVFGAAEYVKAGDTITALVELKEKETEKGKVFYLRAQAAAGVRSNVKLAVGQYDDANCIRHIRDLPVSPIAEQGRRFFVGFVSA